jgi:DNA polymerase III delta prime subunit
MAVAAVHAAMNFEEHPDIHPFFTKTQRIPSPERTSAAVDPRIERTEHDPEQDQADNSSGAVGRRKRVRRSGGQKGKRDFLSDKKTQASLERFTQKLNGVGDSAAAEKGVTIVGRPQELNNISADEDLNMDRRKRRKTATPHREIANVTMETEVQEEMGGLDWHRQLQMEAEKLSDEHNVEPSFPTNSYSQSHSQNDDSGSTSGPPAGALDRNGETLARPKRTESFGIVDSAKNTLAATKKTTPKKKVLKLTTNGKLLSPSSETPSTEAPCSKKKRGRKSTKAKPVSSIVVIKYGSDSQSRSTIGKEIANILSGQISSNTQPTSIQEAPAKAPGPSKPTHPFFLGKPAQSKDTPTVDKVESHAPDTAPLRTPRKSAVTPGKLKTEVRNVQSQQATSLFGPLSGDRKVLKHPGMSEAPWPGKDTCHVRNLPENEPQHSLPSLHSEQSICRPRKMKNGLIAVPDNKNILSRGKLALRELLDCRLEQDDGMTVKDNVRLPKRLLTTGIELQNLIRNEVVADLAASSGRHTHPALKTLYDEIQNVLTPFDKGECEPQSWTQKYSPRSASHVLQSGKEATVLRDWLKNLTVMSVDSRKESDKTSKLQEGRKPPKKKRKSEVDDFIMGSDEEDLDELVEFSDSEQFGPPAPGHIKLKSRKTLGTSRNNNVVILSGPHGCGKSATVYAVAKEMGFEVFEINSSSRRSGKDVQDRVGDMSENHLVSHNRVESKAEVDGSSNEDADEERNNVALQKDLDTGRQGTMTTFFKAASRVKPKSKSIAKTTKAPKKMTNAKALTSVLQTLPISQRTQKQSLILLEEVDVLFEEDQQFWTHVIRLASQSKRPIVLTCNDENAIPTQALRLSAILRLSPPPVDLAIDYMLLLCAREGHILERAAIHDLYEAKDHDLRASITELDFWCQMSVGDRKGGLEWIYQRWPPGKDVDEHGRILRVASQGTYLSGMGWLSHDIVTSSQQVGFDKEEELLTEVWQDWGINPAVQVDHVSEGEAPTEGPAGSAHAQLAALKHLELTLDSMSAADTYCRVGMPSDDNELVDTSLPMITDKERLNYLEGACILQADPISDFTNFDTSIFVQSQLHIQRLCKQQLQLSSHNAKIPVVMDEARLNTSILEHKVKESGDGSLSRWDFSNAFDVLTAQPSATPLGTPATYPLTASSFDRTLGIIAEDLAPFVRCIVAHELRLDAHRVRVSNLLSEGGRSKRARTTRASQAAMEGGRRETKRRDHWFDKDLNKTLVMATAGTGWAGLGSTAEENEGSRTGDSLVSGLEE